MIFFFLIFMTDEEHDDSCCCGCCIGLAIGYLLWHNPDPKGAEINYYQHNKEPTSIVEIIDTQDEENFLLKQISNYQTKISPKIKEELGKEKLCKFTPSCSEYAKQAIKKHGKVKGSLMAMGRLARCNPLSDGGYDPVK
jgi:putative membrane protein insertion efficiency factor